MKKQNNGESPTLNMRAVETYLRFSFPAGDETILGKERVSYPVIRFPSEAEKTGEEYLEELNRILDKVFEEERRSSDAAFLSSGVDSTLIAFGIGAKKTFSVAYEEEDFDESALAKQAADRLKSEHHTIRISAGDYFGAVSEAMACRRQPTGDASYIALFLAAREAAFYTESVCSGEGPDEMFCGYPCYSRYFDAPEEDFWLKSNTIMDIGSADFPELSAFQGDGFQKMNAFDLSRWMYGNILPNIAAAAKGAGIEIRTPYMNRTLWDFALRLPVKYKANRRMGKLLFREAARRYVGEETAFREKRGFPVPVRKWMRQEPWKTQITDALTGTDAREVLCCVDREQILNTFYSGTDDTLWKQIWEMFALIRWVEEHQTRIAKLI